jgi:hypothetical protein
MDADLSKANFTIAYDGRAIQDGSMDVRDLAPALMAVGQLFDAANRALNGSDAPAITVNVKATNHGSFEINLEVIQTFLESAKTFLTGDWITAALNLKELVFGGVFVGGGTVGGLIWLIRKLRGRAPERIERLSDNSVRITVDGKSYDIPLQLLRLYQDVAVRKAYEELVTIPLQKDGIDEFKVLEARKVVASVEKNESIYFIAPEPEPVVVIEDIRRSAFSIVSLAFKEDNKWRLHDGNNQISAAIEDTDFLRKVDANLIRFAKGDVLVCEVKVRQVQTAQGLKTDYTVMRVLEHRAAARQIDMFIEEPPAAESSVQEVPPEPTPQRPVIPKSLRRIRTKPKGSS